MAALLAPEIIKKKKKQCRRMTESVAGELTKSDGREVHVFVVHFIL